jgi:hypothetical protein
MKNPLLIVFCFIWTYKASLALYAQIKQKQSKVDFFLSKAESANVGWVGIASAVWEIAPRASL